MSWNEDERHVVVSLPKGVSQSDLAGLLEGFSKATNTSKFNINMVPAAYGNLNGYLLIPAKDIVSAKSEVNVETRFVATVQLRCDHQHYSAFSAAVVAHQMKSKVS